MDLQTQPQPKPSNSSEEMDLEGSGSAKKAKIELDPGAIENKYTAFKTQMVALATNGKFPIWIDHNAEIVASIVMAACMAPATLRDGSKYLVFFEVEKGRFELRETIIDSTLVKAWAKSTITPDTRSEWYPFLAALQLSSKIKDAVLWQRNIVSRNLGVSPVCEPYAVGYNIRDRLKKSRPLSVGPLNHLDHWLRINNDRDIGKGKKLSYSMAETIKRRLENVLMRQTVGQSQKAMLRQIFEGKTSYVRTLAHSYCSIKPHIENQFVLPYSAIAVIDSFEGANMSGEWVFQKLEEASAKVHLTGPSIDWAQFMAQILIHCTLRTLHEDLGVLSCMFGGPFSTRKDFGRFCSTQDLKVLGPVLIKYQFWSKPQRGAPRNLGGVRKGQISSRPSLRGARTSVNKFQTLEQLEAACCVPQSESLVDALNKEFEEYAKLEKECTGVFMERGGTNEYRGIIVPSGRFLFEA
ncbi:nucleoprotein [Thailand tick thogotovirus]|uniref:Nucleoprotein n=1 Tax=Thailand tick thogotovirus TaxID=2654565 RepID=A0A5P8N6J4_9ORTO|nr:nucleoprotein [Thailand tick thogotovirus]QFR36192.1 nucleoprotein [Thailand tick thogotovirus]